MRIRPPAVAGQFYPEDPSTLRKTLERLYAAALPSATAFRGSIVGCVSPHAGYMYSGVTAAHTYQAIRDADFETAVLVGPSHRDMLRTNAVYGGDAFRTPLGDVPVDRDLAGWLLGHCDAVKASDLGHREEHALEVQLPFLQFIRPDIRIVPITMGIQDARACNELADCLAGIAKDRNVIFIASSDLSHYHPYEEARRIDAVTEDLVSAFQADRLLGALESHRVEACGGGPMVVVMMVSGARGASKARVLFSCNSGDVSGDHSGVVGYLSAVFGIPS